MEAALIKSQDTSAKALLAAQQFANHAAMERGILNQKINSLIASKSQP